MKLITLSLILLFVFTACSSNTVTGPEISKQDNGKSVSFNSGTDFNLVLEGNPTTGFTWKIISIDTVKIQPSGEYNYESYNKNADGSPGRFTFKFKAKEKGASTLKLGYLRVWEKGIPPIDSFKVKIIIK